LNFIKLFIFVLILFNSYASFSQDKRNEVSNSELFIPTLGEAIDMAMEYSPLLKSVDIETTIKEFQLKTVRKEWLDNMGVESFYKYGSIDNVNIQNVGSLDEISSAQTTDTRYSVGVYLKMSFFTFLTQRTNTKIALQEIEQSKMQKEFIKREIRKVVIKQYGEFLYNKDLISIKNKAFQANEVQLTKANIDYANGNLSVYEITKVMEALTKSESEYLMAKSNFKISYLLLLELIGTQTNGKPIGYVQPIETPDTTKSNVIDDTIEKE